MQTAAQQILAGDLQGARATLVEAVRLHPSDATHRFELAELQMLLGEWERADGHLTLASTQDPTWTPLTAILRQLIRAAVERQEVFEAARAPEFAVEPTPALEQALRALIAEREGSSEIDPASADEVGATLTGEIDGRPFTGLRDLDDRTAGVLEILTGGGQYMWAPWSRVRSLAFRPAERLRDLVWRAAELELEEGPSGLVYIPAIYSAPGAQMTDALRLGRETDWIERGGRTHGLGQRCLLVGEDVVALGEITELTLRPAA